MMRATTSVLVGLALAVTLAGCRVNVEKDAKGEEKNVQVDTPFGGVHVNTDQTTAADLGLPVYPGAQVATSKEDHGSADVHLGFGQWQLRVQTVSYESADSQEKVVEFYKKALKRYGDVIACQGKTAVGKPASTKEGLTCEEENGGKMKINSGGFEVGSGYELKAGSKRHQHIVGFESAAPGKTSFSLVALDLPAGGSGNEEKSN